jgi:hypothetical protein
VWDSLISLDFRDFCTHAQATSRRPVCAFHLMATSHSRQRCALNDVPTRIEAVTMQHPITGGGTSDVTADSIRCVPVVVWRIL